MNKLFLLSVFACWALILPAQSIVKSGRTETDLSHQNWNLCLDTAASWQQDVLYTPPVKLASLPVNKPSGGWDMLKKAGAKRVQLPATVEEFYWGRNGNAFGVSGNYLGVSWFSTQLSIPAGFTGKRVTLQFESVRFRAEIFLNGQLVGYDLISGTPFEVDISEAMKPGKLNELAVRITDPNGNFDWRDSQNFMWGDYRTQPSHGFGGITGKVKLLATDKVFISDIFIRNNPDPKHIDVIVEGANLQKQPVKGNYELIIKEKKTGKQVYRASYPVTLESGTAARNFPVTIANAKLWSVDQPDLYDMVVEWKGADATKDLYRRSFGFRWFEVKDIDGDRQFYLNGKRIVLRTSISWGFWPVNGIAPPDSLARRQVLAAKQLGLNMLNFHRTIGQTNVLDAADELGLLYFEEPGGNQYPRNLFEPGNERERKQTTFYMGARNEKLFRMIRRDRNHPSLVIYNMHNERGAEPAALDSAQIKAAHQLDPSRIITYNSSNGPIKMNEHDPRFKLHMMPYDTSFYSYGWFDQHHAGGPGTYHDNLYNHPKNYAKYIDHKDEIVYYGEEGAIGTPPRLQLIRNEILKTGKDRGWESEAYLKWYAAYDSFLKEAGFSKAFPNVDSLTRKMGNVAYYYQGRIIENTRINNTIDGYAVNGWESMKLENHSGVVDNYRFLKGDADLIARYNQPLYVAVKLNHKIVRTGDATKADFFIVNEKDVKGNATLEVVLADATGKTVPVVSRNVTVTGGVTYGELLLQGISVKMPASGYNKIIATLKQHNQVVARGMDEVLAVTPDTSGIGNGLCVADTTGVLQAFLSSDGIPFKPYVSGRPNGNTLLVGAFEPQQTGNPLVTDLLEWVNDGNTLVVVDNIDQWASFLAKKEVLDYKGFKVLGTSWYGGNYFVKAHPLLEGLPQSCVFNWEYQALATYNKKRTGLRIANGETVVACVSDHKPEVYSALSVIPHGRGRIVISALDIMSCLTTGKQEDRAEGDGENAALQSMNLTDVNPANIVAKQLLLNLIRKK